MADIWSHQPKRTAASGRGMRRYASGMVLCFACSLGVYSARADECGVILKAFEDMASAQAYSQTILMKDMAPMRSIAIGDVLYFNPGDKWQKMTLKPGGRLGILKSLVPDAGSLKDCAKAGADQIGGQAMTTYTYMPPVPEGMESLASATKQTLWVGNADGLPYRMTDETVEMTISYSNITPPAE